MRKGSIFCPSNMNILCRPPLQLYRAVVDQYEEGEEEAGTLLINLS